MNKKIISFVLCLTLLFGNLLPIASAEEGNILSTDDVFVENTESVTEPAETEAVTQPSGTEAVTEPVVTTVPAETVSETQPEPTETDEEDAPAFGAPACDCGSQSALIIGHSDVCVMKQFYKDLCAGTASDVYALWNDIPKNAQAYIMTYLGYQNPAALKELVFLLASKWESESGMSGVAAAIKDGTLFGAFGIPEDAVLQIKEAAAEAKAAIEAFVAQQKNAGKELFTWDISVLNGEGISWQPDGSVRVELELPGEKLHKYTQVYVVHVDDEGNAEKIEAEVIDGNKIAFYTHGFSTFAGFTVDFEYDGTPFSIPGMSSILLSELMDKLKMPFEVADVADVAFTNYDLIAIEKQENDWLLTSLQAFQTEEALTLTMTDGKVYEIKVTDASAYPTICWNNDVNEDGNYNGVEDWTLTTSKTDNSIDGSHTENYDIRIDGTNATNNTFTIVLQHPDKNSTTRQTLYLDLHTIWVKGGANLVIRLGGTITNTNTEKIIISQVPGYKNDKYGDSWWLGELFWIENGSLEIRPEYDDQSNVKIEINAYDTTNDTTYGNAKALVSLREGATYFKADQCVFKNTQEAAIVCRANDLDEFIMTDCEFTDTSKPGGNGASIYAMASTADPNGNYVDIHRFELNNCKFTNSVGGGYGGAVALFGYVHSGLISGCTFTNCKSTEQGGGALELAGSMGAFTIQNSKFSGCTSKYRGGAIEIRSTNIKNASGQERWTRSNAITISGCTFENCSSTDSHGGAIAVKGQIHTLSISGSSFTDCTAGINGGAISIDGQDLPDTFANTGDSNPNWTAALSCSDCVSEFETIGTTLGSSYNWGSNEDKTKTIDKKSIVHTVNITDNCTFTNCSCASNGGAIEFASGMYITGSSTISNTTIDGCKAVGGGSAIFTSNCIIKKLNLYDDIFQNCDFNPGADDVGGTVRTTGPTTIVLDVQRSQFLNNKSYGHAGGIYWNAARSLAGIECAATVSGCTFDGNEVGMYGGAIYVESKMEITQCHIKNNTAGEMGGGIAQQVYNNPGVRMLEDGDVSELKLDPNTWIHHNTAPLGGGISIRANETGAIEDGKPINFTVRFELNGAAVYENEAIKDDAGEGGHGGGIYFIAETCSDPLKQAEVDKYSKIILINQGTGTSAAVYKNTAAGNGGGIYMESSENTELRVQGGFISTNTANNGGGIYMTGKNATCYVEGGTIGGEGKDSKGNDLANHAVKAADGTGGNGGGIAISGGSAIEMSVLEGQTTGGTISYNTADADGGGIFLDERSGNYIPNKITIEEGSVIHNSAGNAGGGISMKYHSEAILNGGAVSHNTATNNGGGMDVYYYANLTVSGGTIEDNTATNGSGGGIFANYYGKIEVKDGSTIKGNHAPKGKGGGVYANLYNVYITGGEITENNAADGGGVFVASSTAEGYETTISGGSIYKNTVTNRGGGIFNRACTKLTVSGGSIYENKAYNGGGIYGDSAGLTTISSGAIRNNEASYRGGGVYLSGSSISITGGSVYENKGPGSGGGLCVMSYQNTDKSYTGSTVTMSGGDIYKNSANDGWGGGIYMWGANSSVSLSGGNIYENSASGCGGGINAEYFSTVTINGGSIYSNAAGQYGGGVQIYNFATINITGGEIYENTANAGGGVAVRTGGSATISGNSTSAGKITNNTAVNGGGVFVGDRADLTVNDAFITYNNATSKPTGITTAYQLNESSLKGTGGGIFVADGTSADPSTFKLEGSNIAIYGNIADFAADDVFANGKYTKLTIPKVTEMNLSGHNFQPDDWFEDYPEDDTSYSSGLVGETSNTNIHDGSVWRYRGSGVTERVTVDATDTELAANTANTYVCMTLGAAAALPDTIVVDYGLPVEISVVANDLCIDVSDDTVLAAGKDLSAFTDASKIYKTDDLLNTFITTGSINSTYGKIEVSGTKIKYTPRKIINNVDTFAYAVKYNSVYYYAAINVIPATTVYYEDTAAAGSFVTYNSYKYEKGTTTHSADSSNVWKSTSSVTLPNQSEDRPGITDLEGIDANNIYGYDGAYSTMKTFSQGAAKKFTAKEYTSDGKTYVSYGTAEFTFRGTGFDIISLTHKTTGAITVQVYKSSGLTTTRPIPSTVSAYKTALVDTYYGYEYVKVGDDYVWQPSTGTNQGGATLYQVPVIKMSGLPYGTYTVVITVSYSSFFDHYKNDTAYDFYLDAIRIYDPLKDGSSNSTVKDAYVSDGEGWPEYFELRNILLKKGDFDSLDNAATGTATGVVFLDNTKNTTNAAVSVSDYKNYGPNNELYIAPGQSVAFKLNVTDANISKIMLGMKSVGGSTTAKSTANVLCYDAEKGASASVVPDSITTSTDMYYDITGLNGKTVVIKNTGTKGTNAILSLTNIKVTYTAAHTDNTNIGIASVSKAVVAKAIASINQYYSDMAASAQINTIGATLSFEDEIFTNLYYTTSDMEGVSVDDMGLLTWSAMPEVATFDNAENVFAGAVYNEANGRYMVRTGGIASKNIGDDIYMCVYAQLGDGSYVYSDVITYSPKQYAMSRLENSSNENLKALCVAMLNYGAAAQTYFGYKTDVLANADLTAEQQALVSAYSADLFRGAIGANAAKVGEFAKTETGFGTKYASVSFESAFAINYYFAPTAAVDSDVTMYYWTADAYASADTLTAENASGALTMVSDGSGNYWAQISGIAAKQLDETYYVAAVYTSNGETFCTGVIAYSLSGYCMRNANGNMGELAQATAMYGYYAQKYFG